MDIPPGLASAPSYPQGEWELLEVVVSSDELLTMHPREAEENGFVSAIIDAPTDKPLSGLMKHFNITTEPTVLQDNWSENLVDFLTTPSVTGFLFFPGRK